MMEEQDILDEVSGDLSGNDWETIVLPAYLAYLSLGFKVIATVIITLMAGWVIVTIKTTRTITTSSYVANLMAANSIIICADPHNTFWQHDD